MTQFLITPSLLNSFLYMQSIKDPEKRKEKEVEMLGTLRKEKKPSVLAMDRGIEFENLIEQVTKGVPVESLIVKNFDDVKRENLNDIINSIAAIVKGGTWQDRLVRPLCPAEGEDSYLLYGKSDIMKRPIIIYDIKYTGRRQLNKFSNSVQHRIYMYCTGIDKFSYLISNGKDWWREDYYRNAANDQAFLETIIREFRDWLSTNDEANEAFQTKWVSNKK